MRPGWASQCIDGGDTVRRVQLCYSFLHHVVVKMNCYNKTPQFSAEKEFI